MHPLFLSTHFFLLQVPSILKDNLVLEAYILLALVLYLPTFLPTKTGLYSLTLLAHFPLTPQSTKIQNPASVSTIPLKLLPLVDRYFHITNVHSTKEEALKQEASSRSTAACWRKQFLVALYEEVVILWVPHYLASWLQLTPGGGCIPVTQRLPIYRLRGPCLIRNMGMN